MRRILVVANETIGGQALIDKVLERAAGGDAEVIACVPRTQPRHGNVIYDDAVYDAAQIRLDRARGFLRERSITAVGEVGPPDPYTATMTAAADWQPDEIVISTFPVASSGFLRRALAE